MKTSRLALISSRLLCLALVACQSDQPPRAMEAAMLERLAVDDSSCPWPRCFETLVPTPADVSVSEARLRIILPAQYDDSDTHYPILYLLHDAPGDYRSWTQQGLAYEKLAALDVIAVMPDSGGGNPGWYSDWLDGSFQWQRFHMEVMLPWLESQLRVLGDGHRGIAGPSMGGHGAMKYAAQYPGRFTAAAGFSGAVDFLHLEQISALYTFLGNPVAGTPNGPIWGNPLNDYPVWQAQDPGTHVQGLANTTVFLSSGNGLPGGPHDDPNAVALYAIEPLLEQMNLSFAQALAEAGIAHETWFYGPGYHDWPYYRDAFDWALPQMMMLIQP